VQWLRYVFSQRLSLKSARVSVVAVGERSSWGGRDYHNGGDYFPLEQCLPPEDILWGRHNSVTPAMLSRGYSAGCRAPSSAAARLGRQFTYTSSCRVPCVAERAILFASRCSTKLRPTTTTTTMMMTVAPAAAAVRG